MWGVRNIRRDRDSREIQQKRFAGTDITCNGRMGSSEMRKYCQPDASTEPMIRHAIQNFGLSARAYDRILRVARTVADLDGSETIQSSHLFEAIGYRMLDRRT